MKSILKKIYFLLPKFIRRLFLRWYEDFYARQAAKQLGIEIKTTPSRHEHRKPHVLFYQPGGLGHGGTDKHTQNLAKYLDKDKFDVYYMYSEHSIGLVGGTGSVAAERKKAMGDARIKFIEFDYKDTEKIYPYIINDMKPSLFEVIDDNEIDLIVTVSDGKAYYPINLIRHIPIILLNCFGSYNAQKNIVLNLCYTKGMTGRVKQVRRDDEVDWLYIPSESPISGSREAGQALREQLGIKDTDVVFGRIGRDVDTIFHPIGIRAFQKVVKDYPQARYLIMSPPPILKKIVAEDNIPNVHFLAPSSNEEKIWAFHQALDVYGHFRNDGETFAVNIAEALMCDKPVITHQSFMWNEHLSYLDERFSRVAGIDDVENYIKYMIEFIRKKPTGELARMGKIGGEVARRLFNPVIISEKFGELINKSIRKMYE